MAENREMFNEIIDQEEDIILRKQLIEEVKNIPSDADWNTISSTIQNLKRRWRRINYWESAYEDTLEAEFEAAIDVFYGKRKEIKTQIGNAVPPLLAIRLARQLEQILD